MSSDKFTYKEGDLVLIKPGKGPGTIGETIVDMTPAPVGKTEDDESGKPDPDFRAPDFSPKP
jgi:hypothetical protein